MFCINCGKQLPNEARFCAYCGKALVQQNDLGDDFKGLTIEVKQPACEVIDDVKTKVISVEKVNPDSPEGAYIFAKRYETGEDGFERSLRKAFDLNVKAARAGYDEAQLRLGSAYENGELNLKENYDKAYDWYLKAANNGNVEAMFILAEAYNYEELDLEDDEDEEFAVTDEELECMENAKKWLKKAAACNHKQAERMLRQYSEG